MTNRYRVAAAPAGWPESLPFKVQTADAAYGIGEEFEHEFTPEDEAENLKSGLLELLPNTYRVIGESTVHDTAPGGTFERPLPLQIEALLVAGGHIERVERDEAEEIDAAEPAESESPEPPSTTEE